MSYSKHDVAGVVVLYNSSEDTIKNILSYSSQVDRLFVIDNSESPSETTKEWVNFNFPNAHYETNNGNKGVAYALNKAGRLAIGEGYKFLLTMDDDSSVPSNLVYEMLSFFTNHTESRIGIVSVNHSSKGRDLPYQNVLYTMTSGNLLNLTAYQHVGPFMDALFIDHVDHEYGMRLNAQGFCVVELTDLEMSHRLGVLKSVNIFLKKIYFISHSPIRIYYMSRNGIYVAKKYVNLFPKFFLDVIIILAKEFVKIILFDSKKLLRLKALYTGIIDGLHNRLGIKKYYGN